MEKTESKFFKSFKQGKLVSARIDEGKRKLKALTGVKTTRLPKFTDKLRSLILRKKLSPVKTSVKQLKNKKKFFSRSITRGSSKTSRTTHQPARSHAKFTKKVKTSKVFAGKGSGGSFSGRQSSKR